MFSKDYVPQKPFPDFKWKWASLQCTEGINDPVVLLGILFRMRKLEGRGLKYSSPEFANELVELSNDVRDSVDVDLAKRTGKRNIIRNSGQYWKAVGLIPDNSRGLIRLTDVLQNMTFRKQSFRLLQFRHLNFPIATFRLLLNV